MAKFYAASQIELIALHPNSTHIIQPMDQSMFRPMKAAWTKQVYEYRQQNDCLSVSKIDAAQESKKVFNNLDLKRVLSNGFKACGLMPFSCSAIDYTKIFQQPSAPMQSSEQPNDRRSIEKSNIDYFIALKCIEESISPTTLTVFRAMGDKNEWTGRTEDTSLFMFGIIFLSLLKLIV